MRKDLGGDANPLAGGSGSLDEWLRRCLEGHEPASRSMRAGVEPYEFVLTLCGQVGDDEATRRLAVSVSRIFCEVAESPVGNEDLLYQLLNLIDELRVESAADDLYSLLESGLYEGKQSGDVDLHDKALLVLASMRKAYPIAFWRSQMADPRYLGSGYTGLLKLGLSGALPALPLFMAKRREGGRQTDFRFPLYYLLDTCGSDTVLRGIQEWLGQMPSDDADEIRQFFEQEGYWPLISNGNVYQRIEPMMRGVCIQLDDQTFERASQHRDIWARPELAVA